MTKMDPQHFSCPLPILNYDTIQLAHGSGGKLSNELIEKLFLPCFGNQTLNKLEDQAVLERPAGRLAFSTDSFVVSPVFFPGGNIGELAVNGTVNDVSMSGAVPRYLTAAFILEEGLSITELHQIVQSMQVAAEKAGVTIVTGDTKVVNKGSCDKIFINTSGIGILSNDTDLGTHRIRIGDKIIVSGTIADHGMAVMTTREGLSFQSEIRSDTAALNHLVRDMLQAGGAVHALRDPTRGGVATTLNEMAHSASVGLRIREEQIPVRADVRGACEILGLDPLYVANEGKLLAFVSSDAVGKVLDIMHKNDLGRDAAIIGEVIEGAEGNVLLHNRYGVDRRLDMPIGEQLPRIC